MESIAQLISEINRFRVFSCGRRQYRIIHMPKWRDVFLRTLNDFFQVVDFPRSVSVYICSLKSQGEGLMRILLSDIPQIIDTRRVFLPTAV